MSKLILVSGYLIRNPLGGHLLSIFHWLVGLRRLGFEVVFVEHHGWTNACYNLATREMTDDPSFGIAVVQEHFEKLNIGRWCYVDPDGNYHGMPRGELRMAC